MWRTQRQQVVPATADQVWECYADPGRWPEWDQPASTVTADGPLAVGTRGRLTAANGSATSFRITEVSPGVAYTDVSRLPLTRLRVDHQLEPVPGGTRVTHRVTLTGPVSRVFGILIGASISRQLAASLARLAALAPEQTGG